MKSLSKEVCDFIALHIDEFPCVLQELLIEHLKIQVLTLRPSLVDLLDASLYVYQYKDKQHYIPLWYHDMLVHLDDQRLIIHCIPDVDPTIMIDENNHIHYEVHTTIDEVWKNKSISIDIGPLSYELPASKLYIRDTQTYVIAGKGIHKPTSMDDVGDIVIHIYMK